jgi:hypothetical protein
MEILLTALIASLAILGFHYTTLYSPVDVDEQHPYGKSAADKEIFWWYRWYLGNLLHNTPVQMLIKPLFGCVICMSSIYGTLIYFAMTPHMDVKSWILTVLVTAGISRVLKGAAGI